MESGLRALRSKRRAPRDTVPTGDRCRGTARRGRLCRDVSCFAYVYGVCRQHLRQSPPCRASAFASSVFSPGCEFDDLRAGRAISALAFSYSSVLEPVPWSWLTARMLTNLNVRIYAGPKATNRLFSWALRGFRDRKLQAVGTSSWKAQSSIVFGRELPPAPPAPARPRGRQETRRTRCPAWKSFGRSHSNPTCPCFLDSFVRVVSGSLAPTCTPQAVASITDMVYILEMPVRLHVSPPLFTKRASALRSAS